MSTNASKNKPAVPAASMSTNASKNKSGVPAASSGKFSASYYIIMFILVANTIGIIRFGYKHGFYKAVPFMVLYILSLFILWSVDVGRKYMDKNSGNTILKLLIAIFMLYQFPAIIFAISIIAFFFFFFVYMVFF